MNPESWPTPSPDAIASTAYARPWQRLTTLPELGAATARWLRDLTVALPGVGHPDPTPEDLQPVVDDLTRWGFVVVDARRAVDEGWRQTRASLAVIGHEAALDALGTRAEAAGLVVVREGLGEPRIAGPTQRWGDQLGGHLPSAVDIRLALAGVLSGALAPTVRAGMRAWTIVDPEWGRDDVLWRVVDELLTEEKPTGDDVATDIFAVDRRLSATQEGVTKAVLAHLVRALGETDRQATFLGPWLPRTYLVVFHARLTDEDDVVLRSVGLRSKDGGFDVSPDNLGPFEVVWRSLNEVLRLATGREGPFSLVVLPAERAVAGWWPVTCVQHGSLEPFTWAVAWPGMLDAAGRPGPPAPGVRRILGHLERWGVPVPTDVVPDC